MVINQEDRLPVFVINGFLEAGKTQFISYTLQQDYFQSDGITVLVLCEEGDTEYDKELLKRTRTKLRRSWTATFSAVWTRCIIRTGF